MSTAEAYQRLRPLMFSIAYRMLGSVTEAEDIVQEAFLQAFAGLGRLRDPDRFGAWLAGIVRNISRAAARQTRLMLLADWPEDLHPASARGLPPTSPCRPAATS